MKCLPVMRNVLFAPTTAGVLQHGLAIMAQAAALILLLLASAAQPAIAQNEAVIVDCLPPWEANDRFRKGTQIRHPSLSLNGFDCTSNCNIGYGLKQVLEKVYRTNPEMEVKTVFEKIVDLAKEGFQDTTSFANIRDNTARLQARGFVALAAYVLENNDYDPTTLTPALPLAAQAVESFRTALMDRKWKIRVSQQGDGIKWATPVTNVARAIDFYFALENAYKYYNIAEYDNTTSTKILSTLEKFALMNHYSDLIQDLEGLADTWVPSIFSDRASNRYTLEPGNAPLKMQVAIGYAALTWQRHNTNNPDDINGDMDDYVSRSFKAVLLPSRGQREIYWGYQSDDGKHFWAEGAYYFHLTLSQVIPFLHTLRINRSRQYSSYRNLFTLPFIVNPLHWLADISTPDGKTPPLDDGNKHNMYNTSLLRWTSDYGDDMIGEKFAWIGHIASRSPLYPVEIAIPRRAKPGADPRPTVVGNPFEERTVGENGHQQVVVRRTADDGRQHYILLNGESGDAIVRGEGHEQGDQMQLLYYVDDTSYLMDSGYDKGNFDDLNILSIFTGGNANSTWNKYYDHNVMTVWTRNSLYLDGGVPAPAVSLDKERVVSNHQGITRIHRYTSGKVDILSSSIDFDAENALGQTQYAATYNRDILFIQDPSIPYLVDINVIRSYNITGNNDYAMYYHGNSEDTDTLLYGDKSLKNVVWNNIYQSDQNTLGPSKTSKKLYLQPFSVERSLTNYNLHNDTARETYVSDERGRGVNIKTLKLIHSGIDFTTVAFIHALPSGGTSPVLAKAQRPLPNTGDLEWQYFTRPNNDTTKVDLVVVRSARYSSTDGSIHFPIPKADSFYVHLPREKDYGFARLEKQSDNMWMIDSDFQINLEKSVPRAGLSGPTCIHEGENGHFTAGASGGRPPYTYAWSYYQVCRNRDIPCDRWSSAGSGQAIDFGANNWDRFRIRVEATDNSSPSQSVYSSELDVEVRPSSAGPCPIPSDPPDPQGKTESDSNVAEASALKAEGVEEVIPETYALRQNFPNPFNPSTEIQFDLPEDAMVSLVVYDVLGREVARLVQKELRAGTHHARFDAGNLPSGVYFYRIQAGDFSQTRRMSLLK